MDVDDLRDLVARASNYLGRFADYSEGDGPNEAAALQLELDEVFERLQPPPVTLEETR